mmetsp:Transcript_30479/g.58675  ORF Transcript_30479/g.58675 Transcript_30479/m.58675 type:complete len:214 (-) Transcript_30479:27-668(-)
MRSISIPASSIAAARAWRARVELDPGTTMVPVLGRIILSRSPVVWLLRAAAVGGTGRAAWRATCATTSASASSGCTRTSVLGSSMGTPGPSDMAVHISCTHIPDPLAASSISSSEFKFLSTSGVASPRTASLFGSPKNCIGRKLNELSSPETSPRATEAGGPCNRRLRGALRSHFLMAAPFSNATTTGSPFATVWSPDGRGSGESLGTRFVGT